MPSAFGLQLATHCKRTDSVDLKAPLLAYITNTYSNREAEDAQEDLVTVQQLRAEVALASANASTPGMRESLARYYRYLTSIENRFPISKERGHAAISFVWYDAFRPKTRVAQVNIHFEKAAVLFNLAAVLNQTALSCDRTAGDGLQQACKLFQESAGLFSFLREGEATKLDTPRPQDLSPEALGTMEKLMLAQAQECVYLKAVTDKKAPNTVARLAKQTAIMYEEVERAFAQPALNTYFDKGWLAHTQLKASVYEVEALAQYARALHADDKVNIEVAVLREAFARVQNTKKLAKVVGADMVDSISRVQEAITVQLEKAEKENNSIYLQKVPTFVEAGVSIQGALLVKAVPPTSLQGAGAEPPLFTAMVPDSAAKALSRYTDMVDGVMRKQRDALAAATDNARIKLKEWELPETLEALDPRSTPNSLAASCLPPALLAELEEIQGIGGITHLTGILAEIGELRRGVEQELAAAASALEGDAQEDAALRAQLGDGVVRAPPAATASKPYWDKISQYRQSMTAAGNSDAGVLQRLEEHKAGFQGLAIDAAALKMPRLQAPLVAVGPEDPAQVVAALRRDLDQLQALANERAGMEEALRELKNKDNILPKLMACNPQGHEALFAAELKKYDAIAADIAQNTQAQDQLLARIDAGNRAFRTAFDLGGWRAACTAAAAGIRSEVAAFRELLDHCSEGLRFYLGMADVVKRCRQEVDDFAYTRRVQRDEFKQDVERRKRQEEDDLLARRMQMAGLSGGGSRPPPPPPAAYPTAPHAPPHSAPPPPPSGAPPGQASPPPPLLGAHGLGQAPPPPHGGSFSGPPPPQQPQPQYYGHQQHYSGAPQQHSTQYAPQPTQHYAHQAPQEQGYQQPPYGGYQQQQWGAPPPGPPGAYQPGYGYGAPPPPPQWGAPPPPGYNPGYHHH